MNKSPMTPPQLRKPCEIADNDWPYDCPDCAMYKDCYPEYLLKERQIMKIVGCSVKEDIPQELKAYLRPSPAPAALPDTTKPLWCYPGCMLVSKAKEQARNETLDKIISFRTALSSRCLSQGEQWERETKYIDSLRSTNTKEERHSRPISDKRENIVCNPIKHRDGAP